MKLRKLFAWLMTLVMLLGMAPAAHAELAGCNHDWDSGKWLRGEPQNCLDWKPKTYTCTICGATAKNEECGPCVPGNKTWVVPQASNCQEHGVWEITCKYCGEWLEGMEEPGPHKYETKVIEQPSCTISGWKSTECSYCGSEQSGPVEIPALGHDWGNWSWAHGSAPTCTEGAWQVRTCKRCGRMEDKWVPAGSHKWGPDTLITAATCIRYGVVGHTCTICGAKESWETDLGSHNWGDWKVSKPGDCVSNGEEKRVCSLCGEEQTRATGGGGHVWGAWKVTKPSTCVEYGREEQKCTRCGLTQWERVALIDHSFTEWYTVLLPAVGVPGLEERKCTMCGLTEERETPALDPETGKLEGGLDFVNGSVVPDNGDDHVNEYPPITLEKFIRNTPANGEYFVPGEVLNYALTLRIPDDLYIDDAAIYDPITGDNLPVISYGKGLWASMGIDVFHTVTEEDAARGYVENTAYATWFYQTTGEAGRCDSNTVTVPCGEEELPVDLSLTVSDPYGPTNGTHYVRGERAQTVWRIKNNSEDTVINVLTTSYAWNGDAFFPPNASDRVLDPGDATFIRGVGWYVTQEDVTRGYITIDVVVVCSDGENEYTLYGSLQMPCGPGELPDDYQVPASFTYQIINTDAPVNGSHYVPGELISFKSCLTNTSDSVTLIVDKTAFASTSGNGTFVIRQSHHTVLEPGESLEWSHSNLVTEQNMTLGYIERIDNVYLTDEYGVEHTATDSIRFPCGPGELPDDYVPPVNPDIDEDGIPNGDDPDVDGDGIPNGSDPDVDGDGTPNGDDPDVDGDGTPNGDDPDVDGDGIPNGDDPDVDGDGIPNEKDPDYKPAAGLTVDMTYTNTPANGSFFTPGEVINYLITVTNTGDIPLTNLQVGNSSSEAVVPAPSEIAPGQTIQVPYYKLVYESDAKAGGISSYGHANAFNGDPALPESLVSGRSADVFVPCGMGDGTPSVYYLKIVANAPANGLYFTEGETIKYRLSFGNNTKKDIYNITLNDPMANTRSVAFARRLKAGEFLMGEFEHVVTAADVAAGQIINTATSTWATKAEGALNTTSSNTVVTPTVSANPITPSAQLSKSIKNSPANGLYFVPGETIEYAVIFMNVCPHELHDVEVIDPLKGGNEDATITLQPVVEPNGTLYLSFNYVVTEADAQRGYVTNTATASWFNPEIEEQGSCDSNTVRTETGYGESTDMGLSGAMTFTKEVTRAPQNGLYFTPGEYIRYTFTLTNTGNVPLVDIGFVDAMLGTTAWDPLAVGETSTWDCYYEVTDLDAAAGSVENIAYVNAFDADENQYVEYSNNVTAPCGFPEGEDPFGVLTGLDITKAVESLPLNGSYYTEGETVAYKITYTNSGELPLTDVMIYDAMGGMSEIATAETLTPGENRVCWFNHTVTADDVARGYISNTAIGQFELNGYFNSVSSNTVTVDTNGKQDIGIVYPFWPGDEYDPGTGWLPGEDPSTEGGMPPFGTIDTDTLRNGDAYCVRTITGRDNVSVGYETSFYTEHADTQASILAMNQVGKTPEMQMQAATYAVALWRSEVEKLYQDIFTAADPMAKATVMTEYIRFLTEVANYEALLKNLHPDQPALAAKKIAAMWEDKCVTLCYEMHATAAQRKDSLLSVTPATGAAASECACATTDEVNGKKTYTQSYCPVHGFPFGMIDMLLQSQDTAEAWTMIRQIWSVELSNAYNKAAAKLGVNSALAMVEYNALTQWMMAREASLIALYPENPEVVVQTMVKLIMDRVNDLCQVTK